jgi:hypothetical protein
MDGADVYRKVHEVGVPFVIGLTEATKQVLGPKVQIPPALIAIFWGIALYVVCAIMDARPLGPAALDGLYAGLVSMGLVAASKLIAGVSKPKPE